MFAKWSITVNNKSSMKDKKQQIAEIITHTHKTPLEQADEILLLLFTVKELKPQEMTEIIDFYYHIEDYGHVFHLEPKLLDEPFKKIIEGISEIRKMMDDSYGM